MATYEDMTHKLECRIARNEEVADMYANTMKTHAYSAVADEQCPIGLLRHCTICELPCIHSGLSFGAKLWFSFRNKDILLQKKGDSYYGTSLNIA